MNKNFIIIFLFFVYTFVYADTNVNLTKLLPNNLGEILVYKTVDFNHDGYLDVVLVSQDNLESFQYGRKRTLYIFMNENNIRLNEIVRNNNIIACSKCSNFEFQADPFAQRKFLVSRDGIITIIQYFDIKFYASMAIYKFSYSSRSRKFKTISAKHILYELTDSGRYRRHISNHINEFGKYLDIFDPKWINLIGIQDKFY